MKLVTALLTLTALLVARFGNAKVIDLTDSNFNELTKNDSWLIEFYAPWCGHCKYLLPIFAKASAAIPFIKFGKVDCTAFSGLCKHHEIAGYPTIKFSRNGGFRPYNGARSLESFESFAKMMSSDPVVLITNRTQLETLSANPQFAGRSSFLLFDNSKRSSAAYEQYEEIARDKQGLHLFGVIDTYSKDSLDLVSQYHASTAFDSLVAFYKHSHLFVRSYSFGDKETSSISETAARKDLNDYVKEYELPLLPILNSDNFELVTSQKEFVAFIAYNPEDASKDLVDSPQFSELLLKYRTYAVFTLVDAIRYKKYLNQFGLADDSKLPFIVVTHFPDYYYILSSSAVKEDQLDFDAIQQYFDAVMIQRNYPYTGVFAWYSPSLYIRKLERWSKGIDEWTLMTIIISSTIALSGLMFFVCAKCGMFDASDDLRLAQAEYERLQAQKGPKTMLNADSVTSEKALQTKGSKTSPKANTADEEDNESKKAAEIKDRQSDLRQRGKLTKIES